MDILVKQKRGQLYGSGRDKRDESRKGATITMTKEDKNESSRSQFPRLINQDYDTMNIDFAAAVAASAYAIHSKKQEELQYQKNIRDSFDHTLVNTKDNEIIITNMPSTAGRETTRRSSNKETDKAGSMKKPFERKHKTISERTSSPSNLPSRTSLANRDQRQKGMSSGRSSKDTVADAWEKTRIEKIQKRYEKMKSDIISWENEKKKQAKVKMERRKKIIEQRRAQNLQHYNNKLTRIDEIVRGARAQVEEKIKNEESVVKEKAKKIRSTDQVPLTCFCFRCY